MHVRRLGSAYPCAAGGIDGRVEIFRILSLPFFMPSKVANQCAKASVNDFFERFTSYLLVDGKRDQTPTPVTNSGDLAFEAAARLEELVNHLDSIRCYTVLTPRVDKEATATQWRFGVFAYFLILMNQPTFMQCRDYFRKASLACKR